MDWESKKNKKLVEAVLALKTEDEARRFLRDLMTEKEIKEFSNRLRAAELLMDYTPYKYIEGETGLSSTTIARVSKWLNRRGGAYKEIINRVHHNNTIRSRRGLS